MHGTQFSRRMGLLEWCGSVEFYVWNETKMNWRWDDTMRFLGCVGAMKMAGIGAWSKRGGNVGRQRARRIVNVISRTTGPDTRDNRRRLEYPNSPSP